MEALGGLARLTVVRRARELWESAGVCWISSSDSAKDQIRRSSCFAGLVLSPVGLLFLTGLRLFAGDEGGLTSSLSVSR